MKELKCLRCSHKWYPRTPKIPKLCPSCKSKYWQEKRNVENNPNGSKKAV